jgi:hypothetical protein
MGNVERDGSGSLLLSLQIVLLYLLIFGIKDCFSIADRGISLFFRLIPAMDLDLHNVKFEVVSPHSQKCSHRVAGQDFSTALEAG